MKKKVSFCHSNIKKMLKSFLDAKKIQNFDSYEYIYVYIYI